jgi:vesicle-associated membrane protein 7
MPLIYALISRHEQVLAEYTNASGNFSQYSRVLLAKIEGQDEKKSFMAKDVGYAFHYEVKDGLTYLCLADLDFDRIPCFRFLGAIRYVVFLFLFWFPSL